MSRRLVKKVIRNKLVEWLNTITDCELRREVSRNIIVAGGAINSVMCGGKINDYDVYFTSQSTCVKLLKYYLHHELQIAVVSVDSFGATVRDDVVSVQVMSHQITQLKDVGYIMLPVDDTLKYQPKVLTENALTLTDKIQLITRFVGKPDHILKYFDFAHAMCYYELSRNYVGLSPECLEAMLTRSLIYKGSKYPLASFFRMKKFLLRGWKMSAGQIVKIAMNLQEFDLNDAKVLKEQLLGVDIMYMQQLYLAITQQDEVDATFIARIVDRLFNEGGVEKKRKGKRYPQGLAI